MRENYLPHRGRDFKCACSLDLFAYDDESITQYNFSREETKTLCGVKEGTRLSQKDIAFIAYLYPKPCGGIIELDPFEGSGKARTGHQDFLAVRKSVPRIVTGLTSLFCRYAVHMVLHGGAKKADEAGFPYQYREGSEEETKNNPGAKLSYLAIDQHIEEIYVGEPIHYRCKRGGRITRTSVSDSAKC